MACLSLDDALLPCASNSIRHVNDLGRMSHEKHSFLSPLGFPVREESTHVPMVPYQQRPREESTLVLPGPYQQRLNRKVYTVCLLLQQLQQARVWALMPHFAFILVLLLN